MKVTNQRDEILDLVDEHDNVIGRQRRSVIYRKGLTNFRVVNVFLVNSKGQLWIPRRTADKKHLPLFLEASMGGHVRSGETYEQALERELREELNIELNQTSIKYLGHLTPNQDGVAAFMKVYEIFTDVTPDFNSNDFAEFYWLSPYDAMRRAIDERQPTTADFPKLIRKFYLSNTN